MDSLHGAFICLASVVASKNNYDGVRNCRLPQVELLAINAREALEFEIECLSTKRLDNLIDENHLNQVLKYFKRSIENELKTIRVHEDLMIKVKSHLGAKEGRYVHTFLKIILMKLHRARRNCRSL